MSDSLLGLAMRPQSIMAFEVEIVSLPLRPCVTVSFRCPMEAIPKRMSMALEKAHQHAMANGGSAGPPFARYLDLRDGVCVAEVGIPVESPVMGTTEVDAGTFGGIRAVKAVHVGPYSRLGETHDGVRSYLEENNLRMTGPAFEVYIDDPNQVSQEQCRTEVYWPIG